MKKYNNFKNDLNDILFAIIGAFFLSIFVSWIPSLIWNIIDSLIFILPNISWLQITGITWVIITIYLLKKD